MSIGTTVVAALSKIGKVEDSQRLREAHNGYFIPNEYPIPDGPTGARCSLNFINRLKGEPAIRIVLRSDIQTTKLDFSALLRTISHCNSHNVYGSVNLHWQNMADEHEFTVAVTHSLSLRGLTEEIVIEVIHDLLRLWQTAMVDVRRCIAHLERKAELDERMKAKQEREENRARLIAIRAAQQKRQSSALDEIEALVGLPSVKKFAHGLVAQQHLVELRLSHGMATEQVAPHLVFLGDPGTGKTTVARLVGRLYKDLGLLSKGHVVEVERSTLVGGYIGHTALRTRQMCEKALGGVLFIDEAYSLSVDGRDYGDEALATLLTFMENNRGKLAVIVAGYPKQMDEMLDSNPGLRSRFDSTVTFDNYSPQELTQMFVASLAQQDYHLTESAVADAAYMFVQAAQTSPDLNARSVRGFVAEVLNQHASVLMKLSKPTPEQIKTITSLSVPLEWSLGRPLSSSEIDEFS